MAFEELKENLSEAETNARAFVEHSKEYYELKTFKVLMKGITSLIKMLLLGSIVLLALFILSFAAAFGIGQALDNTFLGFLSVGLFYILLGIVVYVLKDKLNKPLLEKFSEFYFEEI
ncbi:hypothetical protein OO009_02725 [Flavobacteriaceae bacterium KMM 6897]|nr:hypothetical protein [Flavobacteriaceae bacterium KMM 6897]MEB8346261.1 hypothetical protein [Flavobacteriaceae bacterium KMM 6898]